MKKLSLIVFAAFASALLFLSSCGDDDETFEIPSITLTSSSFTGMPGEVAMISGTITAPGGLNVYRVTVVVDGTEGTPQEFPRGTTIETSVDFNFNYVLVAEQVGANVLVEIEAVDETNQVGTATFAITTEMAEVNIVEDQMVLFGAQGNSAPGFYNAVDQLSYSYAQARDNSAMTDFAYNWGQNNNSSIAAIDDACLDAGYSVSGMSWLPIEGVFANRNATRFATTDLAAADFIAVENEADLLASSNFDNLTASSATGLAVDDVIAFKLISSRGDLVGLLHIASIDDTNGNGTITVNVKVQEASN